MRDSWRLSMGWLHTWGGLITGWLLCAIFLTGTLSVFREPITRWMQAMPTLTAAPPSEQPTSPGAAAQMGVDDLAVQAPKARFWRIELPARPDEALRLFWRAGSGAGERQGGERQRAIDPATGAVLPAPWGRETQGGRFFMTFHYSLQWGLTGFWIVGMVSMGMLAALVSGVIVHKRIFSDFFTFRPNKGQRSWLDAHNLFGVLTLPFLFMITLTGLWIFYASFMPLPLRAAYGGDEQAFERLEHDLSSAAPAPRRKISGTRVPLPAMAPLLDKARALLDGEVRMLVIERPGDASMVVRVFGRAGDDSDTGRILNQPGIVAFDGVSGAVLQLQRPDPVEESAGQATHRVVEHLHFARFGGWTMRWLYFMSGLAGTALMATGTILYLVKRRQKAGGEFGSATAAVYRGIDAVNTASISGTALACIGYLYGNRLLPAALDGRAGWEIGCFFMVWLAALLHAALRPSAAAWIEQLALGALLCAGLPLLNALTTGQHLGRYIVRDDWHSAGVELTAIGFGALLATAAFKLYRKGQKV